MGAAFPRALQKSKCLFWSLPVLMYGCESWTGVLTGISGFLSSCNGDLRELLYLPQGSQASFLVVRGNSGFLSRVLQGNWASSRGEAGNSGFLLSCYRDLSENLEFL